MENQIQTNKQTKDFYSSLGVIEAIQHPFKIVNSKDNDIASALVFCFALIGLPDSGIPKGLTKNFLIEFVRTNYKYYSVEEIKTAFVMLVKGELGEKSPRHYNNFSPEYFGSVMALYKSHREKAAIDLKLLSNRKEVKPDYVPNTIQKIKIQQEFDLAVVSPMFEKFKQFRVLDLGTTPAKLIYNSLVIYHKVIEFTNDEKIIIKEQAKEIIEQNKLELQKGKAINYQQHKQKLKLISDLVNPDTADDEIINECHKICIVKCFEKMKLNKFRF